MRFESAVVGVLIALGAAAVDAQSRTPLDVTYLFNEGFLVEAAGRRVLVDALLDVPLDAVTTSEPTRQSTDAQGVSAEADLVLVTHLHRDHFGPRAVVAHLRRNARARLVAHTQVVDELRKEEGFAGLEARVHEVRLSPGGLERLEVNGIVVHAVGLPHSPGYEDGREPDADVRNVGFLVEIGGRSFLHPGDATVESSMQQLAALPLDTTAVDLLFVPWFDQSEATRTFIARRIKPSQIVAMHVLPRDVAQHAKAIAAAHPHAVVFKQSMERRVFPAEVDFHNLSGMYFGEPPPGVAPRVFARGIVSREHQEHGPPEFSPDGNELYWWEGRRPGPDRKEWEGFSLMMVRDNGRWSTPHVAPFEFPPVISYDGARAFFTRQSTEAGPPRDVWFVDRLAAGWSQPKCLDLARRFPAIRWASVQSIARNGTLYFLGYAAGPRNDFGIYRSELRNGEYAEPELLPPSINLPQSLNWTAFVAPDESYLVFSSNRPGSLDEWGDLYISRRLAGGGWADPVSLGEPINTAMQERLPKLSRDGNFLFFSRWTNDNDEDVFWVDAQTVPLLRAANGRGR